MSWAAELKRGLKLARTTIDMALDIRDETGDAIRVPDLVPELTPIVEDEESKSSEEVLSDVVDGSTWSWSEQSHSTTVVDTEPNPILDQCINPDSSVHPHVDNSPSSGSNTEQLSPALSTKSVDHEELDEDGTVEVDLGNESNPVHVDTSTRRGSHEETLTVASSDIEVVKNLDAWSFASSARQMTDDVLGRSVSQLVVTPDPAVSSAIKVKNDNRVADLKRQNKILTQENAQLRHQLQKAIQSQHTMKEEMDQWEEKCNGLRVEGEKMSTENGKVRNELRRAKESLSAAENSKESLVSRMEKLKSKNTKLEKELDEVYEELKKVQDGNETLRAQAAADAKTISVLKSELEEAEENVAAISSKADNIQVLAAGAEELAKAHEESQSELQLANSECQMAFIEIKRLESQLKSSLEQAAEITYERNSLKDIVRTLEQQLNEAHSNTDQGQIVSTATLNALEQRCHNLTEEMSQCLEEKIGLSHQLEDQLEQNKALQSQNNRTTTEKNDLFRQLEQCQKNFANREESCVCKQFDLGKLTEGLHKTEEQLRDVRSAASQREFDLSSLICQLEFNITALKSEIEELRHIESELRREITDVKKEEKEKDNKNHLPPHDAHANVSTELQAALVMNGELLERNRELEHDLKDLNEASKRLQEDLLRLTISSQNAE